MTETINFGSSLIKIEECTNRLRWAAMSATPGAGLTLQQAWSITLLDEKSKPYEQYTDWRDVPTEWHPHS